MLLLIWKLLPGTKSDLSPTEPKIKLKLKEHEKIKQSSKHFSLLVKTFYAWSRQVLGLNPTEHGVPPAKLKELLFHILDQVFDQNESGIETIDKLTQQVCLHS